MTQGTYKNNDYNHYASFQENQLPQEVRSVANLFTGTRIVAWTRVNDDENTNLFGYYCSRTFGLAVLPCFWPHLIILSPCLCANQIAAVNAARNQYWILTETELKVVTMDHDTCCIPGCVSSGNQIKSIPLENITDCGINAKGSGCLNQCAVDLPTIYVDTASSGPASREAVGVGLFQSHDFVQKILQQRSIVKGTGTVEMTGATATATPVIPSYTIGDRGETTAVNTGSNTNKSAEDRILEAKQLLEKGLITQEEFENKRRAIIESI